MLCWLNWRPSLRLASPLTTLKFDVPSRVFLWFLVLLNHLREMSSYLKFPRTSCPKFQRRNQVCCFICFGFFALPANICSVGASPVALQALINLCRENNSLGKDIPLMLAWTADRSWMFCLFQRRNVPERSQSESCSLLRSLAELSCWTSTNCQTQTFPGELSPHQRPEILPLWRISTLLLSHHVSLQLLATWRTLVWIMAEALLQINVPNLCVCLCHKRI